MNSTKAATLFLISILLAAACVSWAQDANEAVVRDADSKPMAEKASAFDVNSLKSPAFKPPADEKKARLWALACAGVLMERNCSPHDTLETGPMNRGDIVTQKRSLKKWWDIEGRWSLIDCLRGLEKGGHRGAFEADVRYVTKGKVSFLQMLKDAGDKDRKNELAVTREYYKQLGAKGILGWDYSRYIALCRWGYTVGYLSEDEAWEKIMPVARLLQKKFGSWKELGENYLIGREYWGGDVEAKQSTEDALIRLLESKNSPWVTLPWNTDLGEGPVMGEPWSKGRLIVVGQDANSIAGAMEKAKAGDTVCVPRGRYKECGIKLKDGVRLTGEGMSRTIIEGEPNKNPWVITATRCSGKIQDLTVEQTGVTKMVNESGGIYVLQGNVEIMRCGARNTSGNGIALRKCARSVIEDCAAAGNMKCGFFIRGESSDPVVKGCTATKNKQDGIYVKCGRDATIERNIVDENGTWGICAVGQKNGKFVIRTNRAYSSKYAGIGVIDAEEARIEDNLCEDNTLQGINARNCVGKVVVTRNRCGGNKEAAIWIQKTTVEVSNNDCRGNKGGIMADGCGKAVISKNYVTRCMENAAIRAEAVGELLVAENECEENNDIGIFVGTRSNGRIEDNRCTGNNRDGIQIAGNSKGSVLQNWCEGNGGCGILTWNTQAGISIASNRCMANSLSGISIKKSGDVTVKDNSCTGNGYNGVEMISGSHAQADGNKCEENGGSGISISDANTVAMLKWNKCLNNRRGGISFEKGAGGEANGNMCSENLWCGIGVRDAGTSPALKANRCNDNGAWGIITWPAQR